MSATIAGVAAAILAQTSGCTWNPPSCAEAGGIDSSHRSIIIIADTAGKGNAGDVVLNWSGGGDDSSGVMFAIYDAANVAYDTAVVPFGHTSLSTTIDIPDRGVVIAASFAGTSAGFPTWSSWTGVDFSQEHNTGTNFLGVAGASKSYESKVTGQTVAVVLLHK